MRDTEHLYQKIMEELDLSREIEDEALMELIYTVLSEERREHYMSLQEMNMLGKELFNAFRKLDILQDLIEDEEITEIMINGAQHIFMEKAGVVTRLEKRFASRQKLEDVVQQIVAGSNRIVNEANPIVDARLPDGSRVNVVLAPIALNGPIVTIRKFPKEAMTMERLRKFEAISEEAADFLEQAVKARYNIFISGGTGSGKTSMLNALAQHIPAGERVITIEDNAEIQIRGIENLVRLEARNANVEGTGEISIRDLIKSALRMRPDRIVVGEVRGSEAIDMLQAMNTGHDGSLSTGHANSTKDMFSRLETMVLMGVDLPLSAVQRQIASAIDLVVHLGRLRDKSRKVLEISEVLAYEEGEIKVQSLYRFEETGRKDGKVQGRLKWVHELQKKEKATGSRILKRQIMERQAFKGLALLSGIAYLFYDFFLGGLMFSPFLVIYLRIWEKQYIKKQQQEFCAQFKMSLQSMSSALNVGYSAENALKETAKDLSLIYKKDTRIMREYTYMIHQLNMNVPLEQIWKEFCRQGRTGGCLEFCICLCGSKESRRGQH